MLGFDWFNFASSRKSLKGKHNRSKNRRSLFCEQLEDRRLLAILWANEATVDFSNYGVYEPLAREAVQRAIRDWEAVITDFNYDGDNNPATNNTFNLSIATSPISGRGSAATTFTNGLPTYGSVS